jgi:hypothetical protein
MQNYRDNYKLINEYGAVGEMRIGRKYQSARRKFLLSATLSSINSICVDLGLNPDLHGGHLAINSKRVKDRGKEDDKKEGLKKGIGRKVRRREESKEEEMEEVRKVRRKEGIK